MPVTMIEELRAKRKGLLDEMRSIQSTAEAADRDLTAEEATEFERREADFDSITGRVERLEKLEGLAASTQGDNPAVRDVQPDVPVVSADPAEQRELEVRAFEKVLRAKGDVSRLDKEERAALQVGTNDEGGFTVPKAFEATLVESMREFGAISGLARHITTAESGDVTIPTVATNATASWEAEEAAFDQSEPTFGSVTLKAYKAGNYAKVSDELLHDSAFDILAFLARNLGEGIGQLTGAAYATGASNSTTTPRGLVASASAGVTTAVNTGFTVDELIDHYHTLTAPYRANAVWLMNDATVKVIRKFTEAVNGQYLWQPGLQAGEPDTLLGRPVYTDTNVPTVAATNRVAVFGDIEKAYIIRDVEGLRVKVLNELFALNGQIGVRCDLRTDGAIYDAAAAKALVIKT
jgi:HK97 family phage major capsid protein